MAGAHLRCALSSTNRLRLSRGGSNIDPEPTIQHFGPNRHPIVLDDMPSPISHIPLRLLIFPMVLALVFQPSACHRADVRSSLAANSLVAHSSNPTMLAVYLPWFGSAGHINVGYSSQDRVVIAKQIEEAKRLGIAGFVVNWYGAQHEFEDKAYALMQQVAAEKNFQVALMYDENDSDPANATDLVLLDLQYAYDHYAGPDATVAPTAYLHYQGRPVIFIFPKGGHADWNRVHQTVTSWKNPPLLIFKDVSKEYSNAFDGFYAWVNPGARGWQADGGNWGEQYLESFYKTMASDYPSKIAMGAAWPGFDDSKASWSQNRKMNSRCGRTFEDTVNLFRSYDHQHPMPFLMVETWNDYEEGTAIEKGLHPCK